VHILHLIDSLTCTGGDDYRLEKSVPMLLKIDAAKPTNWKNRFTLKKRNACVFNNVSRMTTLRLPRQGAQGHGLLWTMATPRWWQTRRSSSSYGMTNNGITKPYLVNGDTTMRKFRVHWGFSQFFWYTLQQLLPLFDYPLFLRSCCQGHPTWRDGHLLDKIHAELHGGEPTWRVLMLCSTFL
jgi:hypothetical protein